MINYPRPFILFSLIFLMLGNMGYAQSDPTGQKRITNTYLITGITLIPSPGKILQHQDILIKDGQILSIGSNLPRPAEAFHLAGDSLFAYPAFIDMANKSGVGAPPSREKPSDFDPSNPPDSQAGIQPQVNVLDHYDPEHSQIADWRKKGFAIAHKVPMGQGMLPGTTGLVVYGAPKSNTIIQSDVARYAKFSSVGGMYPATHLGVMAKFRDLFENARLLSRHQVIFASNQGVKLPDSNPVWQSLIPVVEKSKPLFFEINNELDIRRALSLQREQGVTVILSGISEGGYLVSVIKQSGVNVALTLNLPEENKQEFSGETLITEREEQLEKINTAYTKRLSAAGEYEKAGIPFAFSTKHLNKDKLFGNLRLMIKHGLSEEAALAALTTNPAKILGIEKIAGDISPGKMANLLLTTDSLFSPESQIKYVFANGYLYENPIKDKSGKNGVNESSYWEYETKTAAGSATGFFEITDLAGTPKGIITYDDPRGKGKTTSSMDDLKISEKHIEFSFVVKTAKEDLTITVEGGVSENLLNGKMRIGDYESLPFTAKKTDKPKP
jgi:imidazolonepropionase-like amidohydrolase